MRHANRDPSRFRAVATIACTILAAVAICVPVMAQRHPVDSSMLLRRPLPVGATYDDYREYPTCTAHNQGRMAITLYNDGHWGVPRDLVAGWKPTRDPISRENIYYCMYPKETGNLWLLYLNPTAGALRGQDTVVTGITSGDYDWRVDWRDIYTFRFESASRSNPTLYSESARSDLDITCTFIDTVPIIRRDEYRHRPTMLKITQRSMAWSGGGSDDFILVEWTVQNIGNEALRQLYFGLYMDPSTLHLSELLGDTVPLPNRVVTGFLPSVRTEGQCPIPSTVNVAYVMSVDGRPYGKQWTKVSPLGAVGVRMIHIPTSVAHTNYNWEVWWPYRFAPRLRGTDADPWRRNLNDAYSPQTEPDYYYLLSHKELDYNQMYTATNHYWEGWQNSPDSAAEIASGMPSYLTATLSFGAIDMAPGEEASVVWAIVGGDTVHTHAFDYQNLWRPDAPQVYYHSLNFKALGENARWAGWVYDNPGFDTDGDGYAGKFTLCENDTVWYEGDGVPDWRADSPPPSPIIRVIPAEGSLVVRWNGFVSETSPDPLTRARDFEGYRVYLGLDNRATSFSMVRSYDLEDFVRYKLTPLGTGDWVWQATDLPLTLDSLRVLYRDSTFEPSLYDVGHPLIIDGVYYRFEPQSYNSSQLTAEGIHKVYPDALKPSLDSSQWSEEEVTLEHGRRLPKYYEYELVVKNLLPTVEYWASVTAYDFGFSTGDIPAQESDKYDNLTNAWAINNTAQVSSDRLDVYVWPNPYRFDGNYLDQGYENHDQSLWYDRARRIHFGNLPNKCRISILTLDGDLVKEIDHNYPPSDPSSTHDAWDLITRNTELAVSGIYYWVVEGGGRTQIGKLVVIE